jgi:hypothetical protein
MGKKIKILAVVSGIFCGISCIAIIHLALVYIVTRKFLLETYWHNTPHFITQLATLPLWLIIPVCFLVLFLLIKKEHMQNKFFSIIINILIFLVTICFSARYWQILVPLTRIVK